MFLNCKAGQEGQLLQR